MALALASRVLILLSLALCVLGSRDLKTYTATNSSTPQVPEALEVPPPYKLKVFLFAIGDQYYRYNGTSWVNFSAKARLYKGKKQIGRHFYLKHPDSKGGQPTWETLPKFGVPFSLVTGVAIARVTVDENSIAWVLLKATNNEGSTKYFGDVDYIQRINTFKGLPPNSTSGAKTGEVYASPYTANYAFYVKD